MGTADAEAYDLLKRVFLSACWKNCQRISRDCAIGTRTLECRLDCFVPPHEGYGVLQIAFADVAIGNGAVPELALVA